MNRHKHIFQNMFFYCYENKEKTCMFFVSDHKKIREVYELIPTDYEDFVSINLGTHTIRFNNDSKIIIKTQLTKPEEIKGLIIDFWEDNGFADYRTYMELTVNERCRKYGKSIADRS